MSDNQFLTQNVKVAEAKNHHCSNTLQKELSKLDHDRLQRMRQLNQEELQFRDKLAREGSTLGTSRPTSSHQSSQAAPANTSITTHSPKPVRKTSIGQKGNPLDLQKDASSQSNVQIVVTQLGPTPHGKGKSGETSDGEEHPHNENGSAEGKQQSNVKGVGDNQHGKTNTSVAGTTAASPSAARRGSIQASNGGGSPNPARRGSIQASNNGGSPTLARRGSMQTSNSPGSPNLARRGSAQTSNRGSPYGSRRGSADSGSDVAALTQSFGHLSPRPRSNSLTAAHPVPHKPQRRLSLCPVTATRLHALPDYHRDRSSSFSGIEPVRRRGSICERFGSVSEREVPRGHDHHKRERISMDHLIRDLRYGIHHKELLNHDASTPAQDPDLWQELRNCRYLRVPSQEHVD